VIKLKPVRPAVEGGFTVDNFTSDAAARTVTGITWHLTARNAVIFGACCAPLARTGPLTWDCARTT
jgi:hypothetical protein